MFFLLFLYFTFFLSTLLDFWVESLDLLTPDVFSSTFFFFVALRRESPKHWFRAYVEVFGDNRALQKNMYVCHDFSKWKYWEHILMFCWERDRSDLRNELQNQKWHSRTAIDRHGTPEQSAIDNTVFTRIPQASESWILVNIHTIIKIILSKNIFIVLLDFINSESKSTAKRLTVLCILKC